MIFSVQAHALACSPGAMGAVAGAVACDAGSTNNDAPHLDQVNSDTIHSIDSWQYAGKVEFADAVESGDIDISFAIDGGAAGDPQNGSWSIDASAWAQYSSIMLVLKGSDGNNTQSNYVAYLLDGFATSGNYATPFFNASNGKPKNISHITAYVAEISTIRPVPAPAALPLFISALITSGWVARRRRLTSD